jgi:mycothiol system anti-sigma-R factor
MSDETEDKAGTPGPDVGAGGGSGGAAGRAPDGSLDFLRAYAPGDVDCDETIERLYHFLDGELTEERRIAIQRHLDECHHCLDAFDFEAELRQVIASKCRDKVPDNLRERVAEAIRREQSTTGDDGHVRDD